MSIENKEWLKATNDFALLGIKFLYLSNGGAIIAILGNLDAFDNTIVSCSLMIFMGGLVFSFLSNFFGYSLYRVILTNEQNKEIIGYVKKCSQGWMCSAIFSALASCFCFGYGAYNQIMNL